MERNLRDGSADSSQARIASGWPQPVVRYEADSLDTPRDTWLFDNVSVALNSNVSQLDQWSLAGYVGLGRHARRSSG